MTGSKLSLVRHLRQIAAERRQSRVLRVARRGGWLGRAYIPVLGFGRQFRIRVVVRIKLFQDLDPRLIQIDVQVFQHARGDTLALAKEAQQNMFRAHVGMVQRAGLTTGQRQHFLDARGKRHVAHGFGFGADADCFFDFQPDRFKVHAHFLENVDGNPLAERDEPEQNMLGSHVPVVEPIRLLAGQLKNLLRSGCKIVHRFNSFRARPFRLPSASP